MNAVVTVSASVQGNAEMGMKRRLTEVQEVPGSQLPFRLIKRRTGVRLGSFRDMIELDRFLTGYSLADLQVKPTRRRSRS